jgi:hypothetical protein
MNTIKETCLDFILEIIKDDQGRIVNVKTNNDIEIKCSPDIPRGSYRGAGGLDSGGWNDGMATMSSCFGPYEQNDEKKQSYEEWLKEQLDEVRSQAVWGKPKNADEFMQILAYFKEHNVDPKKIPKEPLEKMAKDFGISL